MSAGAGEREATRIQARQHKPQKLSNPDTRQPKPVNCVTDIRASAPAGSKHQGIRNYQTSPADTRPIDQLLDLVLPGPNFDVRLEVQERRVDLVEHDLLAAFRVLNRLNRTLQH